MHSIDKEFKEIEASLFRSLLSTNFSTATDNDGRDELADCMWDEIHADILPMENNTPPNDEEDIYYELDEFGDELTVNSEGEEVHTFPPIQSKLNNETTPSPNDDQPVCNKSQLTIPAMMTLLALFTVKYHLPGEAVAHLLTLLSLALPAGHNLPSTLKSFKAYFRSLNSPFNFHYYCSFCFTPVNSKHVNICPNSACLKDLKPKGARSYFLYFPIAEQLQLFFKRPGFYTSLQHRFNREKKVSSNIEDIYDGKLYRELINKGILNSGNNISFLFNTDGVPVFKSSKVSIWPLFLVINELPYEKRMAKENMPFAGLWFGDRKPAMATYLKPLYDELQLLDEGILMQSVEKGQFLCRCVLLAGSCDLPARCLVCNSIQFNGEYGCWKCLQRGKTEKIGTRGHTKIFPFITDNPKGPLRNRKDTLKHAHEALTNLSSGNKAHGTIKGIKGPCWLLFLENFDIVAGMGIDYMHGVQKLLLKLWFGDSYSKEPFSFRDLVGVLDDRLREIFPTMEIKRMPRSVSEHLKYWKASELRSFLLFYGAPALYGILSESYFQHYLLLVNAMHLLLKDSISESDLREAENLLFSFCSSFPRLYAARFTTMNIHQLLHLVDDVRDLGPLFTHSCFHFEDKNGFILKFINGTQSIDRQILSAVSFTQKLPEIRTKYIQHHSEVDILYRDLLSGYIPKRTCELAPGVFALGAPFKRQLNDQEFVALAEVLNCAPNTVHVTSFVRLEVNGCYIYGLDYKRLTRRNCSTVKYCDGQRYNFAQVKCFIQTADLSRNILYHALCYPLHCESYDSSTLMNVVQNPDRTRLIAVNIDNILSNCIFISFKDTPSQAYVCEFPNKFETD